MSNTPVKFRVQSGENSLAAKSYAPAKNIRPGGGVVMLHGIVSASDIFDVPGREALSLARRLQGAGIHAITYDQRGAADSPVGDWRFGLRDHALVDLPAVLSACREQFGFERVVLLGHSLGGTIWLTYMESRVATASPQPAIAGGVVIASPPEFDRTFSPWAEIAQRGRAFVESIDHNRDLAVAREEFVAAQIWLYWPRLKWLFLPGGVKLSLRLATASRLVAGLLRRVRIPSLVYLPDDFDTPTFQAVLRSHAVDSASAQLFLELSDLIFGELPAPRPPMALDVLGIGSSTDRLVPLRTVQGFARRFTPARIIATEDAYGHRSGHIGYFFKEAIRDRVSADVIAHVTRVLS